VVFEDPETVCEVLSKLKIVPIDVKYDALKKVYDYIAIGPYFEEVEEGALIPEYFLDIKVSASNVVKAKAVLRET